MPKLTLGENQLALSFNGYRDYMTHQEAVKAVPGHRYDGATKTWEFPKDPHVAERLFVTVRPEVSPEVLSWMKASKEAFASELITPRPQDADLLIPWARKRAPWQPEKIGKAGEEVPFKGLFGFQRAFVDEAAGNKETERVAMLLADAMGVGKMASHKTGVLTPSGWTTMGALKVGDFVIGQNGKPTEVIRVLPQGIKDLYRVTFSDGASVLAGKEHLWTVKTPTDVYLGREEWRVLETQQLLPVYDSVGNRRWRIPMVEPVEFELQDKPLPLDPYTLGVLLGDGSMRGSGLSLTNHTDDISIVHECVLAGNDTWSKHAHIYQWGVRGGQTIKALKEVGVYDHKSIDKFIPEQYLRASVPERLALLQGLMDTDGYNITSRKDRKDSSAGRIGGTSAEIAISSSRLADGIQELVWSLGGTAKRRIKPTTHNDSHRITVRLPPGMKPFRLERKAARYLDRTKYSVMRAIESIEYETTDEAICIQVAAPDGLYVTEDYIVTHNCGQSSSAVMEYLLRKSDYADKIEMPVDSFKTAQDMIAWAGVQDGPKLIVSPASVKGSWSRELRLWLGKEIPHQIVDGGTAKKRNEQLKGAIEGDAWAIVNWEQIRVKREKRTKRTKIVHPITREFLRWAEREIETEVMREPLFQTTPWLAVIADEAHRAKNRKALVTKGLWKIDAQIKLALSGTPLMNTPDELWSILKWLYPDEYTSYWRFFDSYVDYYEGQFGKIITGVKNADALRFELSKRLIRRTKNDVLDLPGKMRRYVPVKLNPKQQKLYEKAEREMWLEVEQAIKAGDQDAINFVKQLEAGKSIYQIVNGASRMVRLRQIASTPALLGGEDDSAKLDAAVEIISDAQPKQFVVFTEFVGTAHALVARLNRLGLNAQAYTGQRTTEERTQLEDDFQAGDIDVMVGTIPAMKEGITLTAADTVIFIERSWTPAIDDQCEDRLDRMGQKNKVTVIILEAENTIDTQNVSVTGAIKKLIVSSVIKVDDVEEERINV